MILGERLTRLGMLALSVLLSLGLFLYVQSLQPPLRTETVQAPVMVQRLDPDLHCEILNSGADGPSVGVRVTGTREELAAIQADPSQLRARIDLAGVKSGSYRQRVLVSVPPGMDDVEVAPSPKQLLVTVEPIDHVARKVAVREAGAAGSAPANSTLAKSLRLTPDAVFLTGPRSQIQSAEPYVDVNLDSVEESGGATLSVRIGTRNSLDVPVPDVKSDHDKIEVQPVRQERALYVNIAFFGHVATGFRVSNYYVATENGPSSTADVRGPDDALQALKTVDVTVDITGLRGSKTFVVTPQLPAGVALSEPPLKIRVEVRATR